MRCSPGGRSPLVDLAILKGQLEVGESSQAPMPNLPAVSWGHFPQKKKMEPRSYVLLGNSSVSLPPGSFPTQRLTVPCVTWGSSPAGTQPNHMVRKPNLSG